MWHGFQPPSMSPSHTTIPLGRHFNELYDEPIDEDRPAFGLGDRRAGGLRRDDGRGTGSSFACQSQLGLHRVLRRPRVTLLRARAERTHLHARAFTAGYILSSRLHGVRGPWAGCVSSASPVGALRSSRPSSIGTASSTTSNGSAICSNRRKAGNGSRR